MTRLETFVDAAFAFAITLLVISVGSVPKSLSELVLALKAAPSFLVSFVLIMMVWMGHRKWSRRFGLEDTVTTLLSLGLVFLMLVYVVPLRSMASALLHFASAGYFPSELSIEGPEELAGLFVIYGFGSFGVSGAIALLYARAKAARELQLNELEVVLTHEEIASWTTMALTGLVSALLALLAPAKLGVWAGFVYPTLCISMPSIGIYYAKKAERLREARTADSS
ncbi:MAG: DUF1211 domain-containing protein [Candidatus Eisenbacteria bacterium]|uniref:DUF1211 domain-containing protein n=1 Tax=Eiseniibacteriota bacterium TaxID=2212470 RepID=A0A7Y2EA30_UNCEI|nr:DUF1211 domain-containing protein [Candidatus Eisenbacteria bacterium]